MLCHESSPLAKNSFAGSGQLCPVANSVILVDLSGFGGIGESSSLLSRQNVPSWDFLQPFKAFQAQTSQDSGDIPTRSKSIRRISSGGIEQPHFGHGVFSAAITFSRLILCLRNIAAAIVAVSPYIGYDQELRAERNRARAQVEKLDQAILVIESLNGTATSGSTKQTSPSDLGGFTTKNGAGTKGEMGECSKGSAVYSGNYKGGVSYSCEAHSISGGSEEDRGGSKSTLGEGAGAKKGSLK